MPDEGEAARQRSKLLESKASDLLGTTACADPQAGRTLQVATAQASNSVISLNGYERNLLFENRGGSFRHLAAVSGLDTALDSRSFGLGDLDRDGDVDVVVKNLQRKLLQSFRNNDDGGNQRAFVKLVGSRSNRDAVGARVEARFGGRRRLLEVRSASGFQSQSPTELFLGLGDSRRIDRLDVFWPSGLDQSFEGLEAGKYYVIHEERGVVEARDIGWGERKELAMDSPRDIGRQSIFSKQRPAPAFEVDSTRKVKIRSAEQFRKPTLVSFATTWLPSFDDHMATLEEIKTRFPNLSILVLMVHLQSVQIDLEAMQPHLQRPLDIGICNYDLATEFAGHLNVLFPSSFLVDGGEIVLDVTGKLDLDETIRHLEPMFGQLTSRH